MNEELKQLVQNVFKEQANPPREEEVDGGFLLQLEILRAGGAFDEHDVLEAAKLVGVPEGGLIDWVEEMAAWVSDPLSPQANPAPATRGISRKSALRGTPEFDDLMDELEDEWELDEEELDDIVEIRRVGDSFEIRLKGEERWQLLEDDDDHGGFDEEE